MTQSLGCADPKSGRLSLKKHKRQYPLRDVWGDAWDKKTYLSVIVKVGKYVYPLCALSQKDIETAEEKANWAVGIPTAYAVRKTDASRIIFPAPDQDGYTMDIVTIVVKSE